jgi:hypothetical protein
MNEEIEVRRLMALLEREFGPVEGARPRLRLVAGGSVKALAAVNDPPRRYLRPTEARKVYGYPGEGMKTGSGG